MSRLIEKSITGGHRIRLQIIQSIPVSRNRKAVVFQHLYQFNQVMRFAELNTLDDRHRL